MWKTVKKEEIKKTLSDEWKKNYAINFLVSEC